MSDLLEQLIEDVRSKKVISVAHHGPIIMFEYVSSFLPSGRQWVLRLINKATKNRVGLSYPVIDVYMMEWGEDDFLKGISQTEFVNNSTAIYYGLPTLLEDMIGEELDEEWYEKD